MSNDVENLSRRAIVTNILICHINQVELQAQLQAQVLKKLPAMH